MSDAVLVALIGAIGIIVVALVQFLGQRTLKREVREVHKSTVNSHDTDLRHDVDKVQTGLTDVQSDLTQVLDMVRKVPRLAIKLDEHMAASDRIVRQLQTRDRTHEDSITDLRRRNETQAEAISNLAKALPDVARSTPAPEDTTTGLEED